MEKNFKRPLIPKPWQGPGKLDELTSRYKSAYCYCTYFVREKWRRRTETHSCFIQSKNTKKIRPSLQTNTQSFGYFLLTLHTSLEPWSTTHYNAANDEAMKTYACWIIRSTFTDILDVSTRRTFYILEWQNKVEWKIMKLFPKSLRPPSWILVLYGNSADFITTWRKPRTESDVIG